MNMAASRVSECNGGQAPLESIRKDGDEQQPIGQSPEDMEMKSLLSNDYETPFAVLPDIIEAVDEDENTPDLDLDQPSSRRSPLPYLGLIMAILSSLFFSLCSLVVKVMENIDPLEMAAFRFVGILLPTLPIVIYVKEQPLGPSGKSGLLLLRGIFGAMSLMMQFYAIRHMPLADASVVIFSAPVFVAIFARIFLKEACGIFNLLVIILTLLGVILITKPPFLFGESVYDHGYTSETLWGAIVALAGTIFNANVYVLLRSLKGLHYAVIMLTFSLIAIAVSFSATALLGAICFPGCGMDRLMIVLLGALSFAGQVLLTKSLQYEQAGPVAICRTADIVFAFIWQVLFFQQVPNLFSIGGAFLVIFSVILTGIRKWIITQPDNSLWKHRLSFMFW